MYWRKKKSSTGDIYFLEKSLISVRRCKKTTKSGNIYAQYVIYDDLDIIGKYQNKQDALSIATTYARQQGYNVKKDEAIKRWNKENTTFVGIRLDNVKDFRIIRILDGTRNKNGLIRTALNEYINRHY